jgi:hypothetical protein
MQPRTFQGVWDEVVKTWATRLIGRRVEITVIDTPTDQVAFDQGRFDASMARIVAIRRNRHRFPSRLLTSQDFYESAD